MLFTRRYKSGPQHPTPHKGQGNHDPQTRLLCRRRPTLPHPPECSTIGAGGLSFRVRNGTGRDPTANTTDKHQATPHHTPVGGVMPDTEQRTRAHSSHHYCVLLFGLLVPVTSTHYCASRSGLSTPSSTGDLKRNLILEQASRLDAFSGYPFRT